MTEENNVTSGQERPPMRVIEMDLSEMKPAPYNPKIELFPGDKEFESVRRSLEAFGFVEPIVVNSRTDYIVGGHLRQAVAVDMGMKTAPAVLVDLSDEAERALNIALNKIGGSFDELKLKDVLLELELTDFDETLTGFADYEIDDLIQRMERDDREPETIGVSEPDVVDIKAKIGDYKFFIPGRQYTEWMNSIMGEVGSDEHEIKQEIKKRLGLEGEE